MPWSCDARWLHGSCSRLWYPDGRWPQTIPWAESCSVSSRPEPQRLAASRSEPPRIRRSLRPSAIPLPAPLFPCSVQSPRRLPARACRCPPATGRHYGIHQRLEVRRQRGERGERQEIVVAGCQRARSPVRAKASAGCDVSAAQTRRSITRPHGRRHYASRSGTIARHEVGKFKAKGSPAPPPAPAATPASRPSTCCTASSARAAPPRAG